MPFVNNRFGEGDVKCATDSESSTGRPSLGECLHAAEGMLGTGAGKRLPVPVPSEPYQNISSV